MPVDCRVAVLLGRWARGRRVFGLRVGSIDFLRRTLTVQATINEVRGALRRERQKTAASVRAISLPRLVTDELAVHLARAGRTDPSDLVVQAAHGGPVRAANFRLRVYGPATRAAGPDGLTFHRLRHSAGYLMRIAGDRAVAEKFDDLFRARW